jgi:acetyl-CoA carboxylase biotin carboxyl carrier protein
VSLTGADIAEIAKLLDESHFTDLRLEMGSLKLRIRRDGGRWSPAYDEDEAEEVRRPALARSSSDMAEPPPLGQEAGAARAGEIDVPAPLLGNFYSAPRPGDPPFVQPGDKVNEETVIGIIEVMKLMNPIRAGVCGTVVALLAENGTAVEDGQSLIRVKVDG